MNEQSTACMSPKQLTESWVGISLYKLNTPLLHVLIKGFLGGMFVALGAHGYIFVSKTLVHFDPGFAAFMGAAVFPVGIIMCMLTGAELFTGNALITIKVAEDRSYLPKLLKNWGTILVGNCLGSVFTAAILAIGGQYAAPEFSHKIIKIVEHKAALAPYSALALGIFCNILVAGAVWMQAMSKELSGKILVMWFPVMLFTLSGFEHCVANMFYYPMAIFAGGQISLFAYLFNLIFVILGNIIGGGIILALGYRYLYLGAHAADH